MAEINVLTGGFGVVGDGTVDDGPGIRNALAALVMAGGGTLYFPARLAGTAEVPAVYWMKPVSGVPFGLVVADSRVHLRGDGPGWTTLTIHDPTSDPDPNNSGVVLFTSPASPAPRTVGVSARDLSISPDRSRVRVS